MSRSTYDDQRHTTSFADSIRNGEGGRGGGSEGGDSDDRRALTLARPVNSSLFVRNVADRASNTDLRSMFG